MKKPTAGIILGAGMSARLGRPKQLLQFQGRYLIEWVLDACLNSDLETIVLVLGHDFQNILKALGKTVSHPRITTVFNSRYREGQAYSVRCGLAEAEEAFPSVMFLLGDQPLADSKMINLLLDRFRKSDKDICVPVCQGKRGTPTIFSRKFYSRIMSIEGDTGARKIIQENSDHVLFADVENPMCFFDIDTEKDIETFENILVPYYYQVFSFFPRHTDTSPTQAGSRSPENPVQSSERPDGKQRS